VRLGAARGDQQEIVAGVAAGDQVVTAGFEGLADGGKVEVKR
jgi:hypothetical protein